MKKRIYKKNAKFSRKEKFFLTYAICFIVLLSVLIVTTNNISKADNKDTIEQVLEVAESNDVLLNYNKANKEDAVYLSDIEYIKNQSYTRWDQIRYDEVNGGGKITVKIENNAFTFDKGIWAHATSQVTYDISNYDYKYFTAFVGLNTTSTQGNGVKFTVYTSKDGSNWEAKIQDLVKTPGQNADFIKVDISEAKFIRLYANDNGGNGADHSVYADAKLVNTLEENNAFTTVEEYDKIIKNSYANQTDITGNFEFTLLKRELIKNVGTFTLNSFYNASPENKATVDWLMNNQDVLRYYILGGAPDGGSYYNSLTVLSKLYEEYSSDFENKTLLNNPTYPNMTYGDLYKKMAIAISLTHSQRVGLWMQNSAKGENDSNPLRRYAIYKYMHKNNRLKVTDSMDMTHQFEELHIEEMRILISTNIDDEEILWLNQYVQDNVNKNPGNVWRYITPHPYIAYVWPNYANPVYYAPENVEYFNELFAVSKSNDNIGSALTSDQTKIGIFDSNFIIPGGKNIAQYSLKVSRGTPEYKLYKVWMNFRNKFGTGAVCGGISKSGANIRGTHGIPAVVVGQPGHAALMFYTKDAEGRGYWRLDNDVSGWTLSGKSARLLNWSSGSYTSGFSTGVYMEYEQAAINDYDNLIKAEELVKLAKVYSGDLAKQEQLYRKALQVQSINFDAWLGLIEVYNADKTKTEDDFYKLAQELAENLKYFPLPMYNATNLIKKRITSTENTYRFTLLQTRILTEASKLPNNTETTFTVVQPGVTRTEANFLLGKMDKNIATFSFDGDNAEKIVLSSRFDGSGVRWDYSLDGKKTWNEVSFSADEPHQLKLTKEQVASITAENDIYVHIVGVNYDEENLFKIDITEGTLPKYNGGDYLYGNDLENRVVGVDLTMEWRYNENDAWTSYAKSSPDLTGDKTVQVRVGATGTKLPSPVATFNFTQDNQTDNRKYIPVSHLTIAGVSTEATSNQGNATFSIDGNYNTRWHSAWNGTDKDKFIIIKFDKKIALSALDYVPAGGGNGKILKAQILGSEDGENFSEITQVDWANNDTIKTIDFENPVEVQYIKIVGLNTSSASSLSFIAAKAFNFYQDITKNPHPTAGIGYNTTNPTNKDVIARLVNPSTTIKITNNNGSDTYTFTQNGEFTFEFIDEATGLTGSAKAKVTWIDKTAPTATIEYSTTSPTNGEVTAKLIPSEDVTITSYGNSDEEEENKDPNANPFVLTFNENGEYTFNFKDAAGNTGTAIAKVTWIDKIAPTAEIVYSNTNSTNENVIATLINASEEIVITNNGGKNTYVFTENGEFTFEFRDLAGNVGSVKATVRNINKNIPTADISYSTTSPTKDKVIATLTNYNKDITITNNDGNNTYVFTENGEFTFEFVDALGNKGSKKAVVTWIIKEEDKPNSGDNNSSNNGTGSTNNNGTTNNGSNNNTGNSNSNNTNNGNNGNGVIVTPPNDNNDNSNKPNNGNNNANNNNNNSGTTPVVKPEETTTSSNTKKATNNNTWKIIVVFILIILVIIISEIHFEKPKKEIPISY